MPKIKNGPRTHRINTLVTREARESLDGMFESASDNGSVDSIADVITAIMLHAKKHGIERIIKSVQRDLAGREK